MSVMRGSVMRGPVMRAPTGSAVAITVPAGTLTMTGYTPVIPGTEKFILARTFIMPALDAKKGFC